MGIPSQVYFYSKKPFKRSLWKKKFFMSIAIGKGTGDRYRQKTNHKNQYFKNIRKKRPRWSYFRDFRK